MKNPDTEAFIGHIVMAMDAMFGICRRDDS